jgi:cytochrome c-type biogenesis protein CcmF
MIAEFGQLSLALAACLALASAVAGFVSHKPTLLLLRQSTLSMVVGQFVFVGIAFVALVSCFVNDDFSVAYVANHSNSLLPWQYKVSATWGGHEGSFLLWILIMSGWMLALVTRRGNYPERFFTRVLGTMSVLNLGFMCFALFTSNPFERMIPMTPADGGDLNPLLQDFGLIVHPPLLYAGYVGLAVPFAFAVAALFENRVDSAWARWSRPWTNFAWAFLTLGIALGSWWAYYELGWGGWWFWDPVENASFMPWLAATALIHSLAVTEKRGTFKSWTLLLAIAGFSLSLLGAFIVRSGVLTSVHAFAVDPERGLYILLFLAAVVGGSLTLYGLRAAGQRADVGFRVMSREFFMLINNVILVVALAVVLWGTLSPIGYEAITGDRISIGVPFFNMFFVPLMLLLSLAVVMVPVLNWKRTPWQTIKSVFVQGLPVALLLGGLSWFVTEPKSLGVLAALVLSIWIVCTHLRDVWLRSRKGRAVPLSYWGMTIAHMGFAMSMIGIAITATQSIEEDVRMAPQEVEALGSAEVRFLGVREVEGPNYVAQQGVFLVTEASGDTFELRPEKRRYLAGGNLMTEAGIRAGFFADTYISLGEPLGGSAWAVRLHYKPLVRWVWFGTLLMALGGILAVLDKRYRTLRARRDVGAPAAAGQSAEGTA